MDTRKSPEPALQLPPSATQYEVDTLLEERLTFLRAQAGVLSMNLHTTGDKVASDMVFAMQRDLEAVTMLFEAFKERQPSVGPGDVETIKDNTREAQELLDRASGLLTGVSVHAGDVIA